MNIKDLKYDKAEQEKFIKSGGLIKAAKNESKILEKAQAKEEKQKEKKEKK